MKKELFSALICFLLFGGACSNRIKTQVADYSRVDTVYYDYTKDVFIPRDSVFHNISYITLETTDDNLIGDVDQVLLGDSTIIIVDRYVANGVFLFDFKGNYVGRMSRLGNGRNEYRRLSYVSKRPDKNFAVFDEISNHIMIFDERGNPIETIISDLFGSAMEFIDDRTMVFDIFTRYPNFDKTYGNVSFVVKDSDMAIRYMFGITSLDEHFNYSRYYNLYSYGNRVYCNVNFEDYIYEFTKDSVIAKYHVLFGPENMSQHSFTTMEECFDLRKRYPYYEGEFVELADYSYFMFRGENSRELIYKHSSKDTYALSNGYDDPMISFFRRPRARYNDNTLVCVMTASELMLIKGVLMLTAQDNKDVMDLYSSVDLDSNPVLFFFDVDF